MNYAHHYYRVDILPNKFPKINRTFGTLFAAHLVGSTPEFLTNLTRAILFNNPDAEDPKFAVNGYVLTVLTAYTPPVVNEVVTVEPQAVEPEENKEEAHGQHYVNSTTRRHLIR